MNSANLIASALILLEKELKREIRTVESDFSRGKAKILFIDGTILYLKFNSFGEYAYQQAFSGQKLDRARFDNFDQNWPVRSAPHHFHPRTKEEAIDSPMHGDPVKDIPLLCELIRTGKLKEI